MNLSTIENRLLALAQHVRPVRGARIVAAVVRKGKIISVACNEKKSDTYQARAVWNTWHTSDKIYRHAETTAIKRAQWQLGPDLSGCVMVVVRAKKKQPSMWQWGIPIDDWASGMAKPCPACAQCIEDAGIKKVLWTT